MTENHSHGYYKNNSYFGGTLNRNKIMNKIENDKYF